MNSLLFLVGLALFQIAVGNAQFIRPGFDATAPHWHDSRGNRIEAHAAGLLKAGDGFWYWYGESKKTPSLTDHGVNAYRSKTLAGPWTFLGEVFGQRELPEVLHGQAGPFVLERPKVLFNEATKTYVMWMHLDSRGYTFRHSGVAVSKQPAGPFTFQHALQPDVRPRAHFLGNPKLHKHSIASRNTAPVPKLRRGSHHWI